MACEAGGMSGEGGGAAFVSTDTDQKLMRKFKQDELALREDNSFDDCLFAPAFSL